VVNGAVGGWMTDYGTTGVVHSCRIKFNLFSRLTAGSVGCSAVVIRCRQSISEWT